MSVKRTLIIWTILAVIFSSASDCYAEENETLAQVYAWEQNMDVYLTGNLESDHLSCKISNQSAEIMDSGLLTDKNVAIRTTILVDISKSMPSAVRKKIKLYLETLIRDIGENEQYKLVTFSGDVKTLQDFTVDRYDLSEAVEQIKFNGKESKLFDAIYNTIPKLQPLEEQTPCYYRTLLITDGIDNTASGVTKEELYLKLQADTYPIDIVAVSEEAQKREEKELSALARISGGKYINLHTESELSETVQKTLVGNVFWLRVLIPGTLLDGSIRQIDISDGIISIPFDVKIPVFDVLVEEGTPTPEEKKEEEIITPIEPSPEPSPTVIESPSETVEPSDSFVPSQAASLGGEDVDGSNKGSGEALDLKYILLLVCLVLCVLIIVILLISKRKKSKTENGEHDGEQKDNPSTEILPNSGDMEKTTGNRMFVRLRNMENPDQIWNLPLSSTIIIGRDEDSQVHLEVNSVSHKQCKLYSVDGAVMAENLSKTNITKLNGSYLDTPCQIKEQDQLKCGRVTIMVDSIYYVNTGGSNKLSKETKYANV